MATQEVNIRRAGGFSSDIVIDYGTNTKVVRGISVYDGDKVIARFAVSSYTPSAHFSENLYDGEELAIEVDIRKKVQKQLLFDGGAFFVAYKDTLHGIFAPYEFFIPAEAVNLAFARREPYRIGNSVGATTYYESDLGKVEWLDFYEHGETKNGLYKECEELRKSVSQPEYTVCDPKSADKVLRTLDMYRKKMEELAEVAAIPFNMTDEELFDAVPIGSTGSGHSCSLRDLVLA